MPEAQLTFIKGDKVSSGTDYRDALPINMYAVERQILGSAGYMLSHPGLTLFANGIGVDRGGYWNERNAIHYRVSGSELIGLNTDGSMTQFGAIPGNKRASMAHSFNTQAIVADGRLWLHGGSSLNEVTDPNLGNPIDITWIDGYYFMTDGEFIYHTDISDETSIDPLKFATAEFSPDPTLAVDKTSDNQVVVFGRYSTEYFINRATDNFAFQRVQGKAIKAGVVGTHCETELEGRFYILGGGREEAPSIHVISAGGYKSIATREVDKLISEYTEIQLADAVLETRVEDRNKFILVRLPNHTLIYNATIAERMGRDVAWSIVKSDILGDTKWRGVNGVYDPRIAEWVYGDNLSGNIGKLDNAVATQYGNAVESIIYTPIVKLENASIDEIEVDTIPGHQVNTDDVTCAVSITYDGVTFSKEWWALYGQKSRYNTRFIVRRLGDVSDNIGFKIRCASPERLAFLSLKVVYG